MLQRVSSAMALRQVAILILVLILGLPKLCQAHGEMVIQFLEYTNPDSRCADGTFCDPIGLIDRRKSACDPQFRLVADKAVPGGNGVFDHKQASVYWNMDSVKFDSKFGDIKNPVAIQMNYQDNPGSLQIQVVVMDKDTISPDDALDTFAASLTARADGSWRDLEMLSAATAHRLTMRYWYRCHGHYYGIGCNAFCQPRDDSANGHFTCDSSGDKLCLPDWTGPVCQQPNPCHRGCLNGGRCSFNASTRTHTCRCPPQFAGSSCEACSPGLCANNATCQVVAAATDSGGGGGRGVRCLCHPGFRGARCEFGGRRNDPLDCRLRGAACNATAGESCQLMVETGQYRCGCAAGLNASDNCASELRPGPENPDGFSRGLLILLVTGTAVCALCCGIYSLCLCFRTKLGRLEIVKLLVLEESTVVSRLFERESAELQTDQKDDLLV